MCSRAVMRTRRLHSLPNQIRWPSRRGAVQSARRGLREQRADVIPFDIVDALLDVGRHEWSDAAFVEVLDLLVGVLA